MSDNSSTILLKSSNQEKAYNILRYAGGSTVIAAVAFGLGWQLSYLTPVLALSMISPGAKRPSLKQGIGFVFTIILTAYIGLIVARYFLPYTSIFILLLVLSLFHIYYQNIPAFLKIFLLLTLVATPFLGIQSMELAEAFTMALIINGTAAIFLVWVVYGIFPDHVAESSIKSSKPAPVVATQRDRIRTATISIIVVTPLLLLFYFNEWSSSLTMLIFVPILTMQPGFAKDFKAGGFMVIANSIGGVAAIIAYEILVTTPIFIMLVTLILLTGLVFGARLFSERPAASLYGSAYSTFLLILGSTTSSDAEANTEAYTRILLIMMAVIYVVVASGVVSVLVNKYSGSKKNKIGEIK
jgi:hypothetical protein